MRSSASIILALLSASMSWSFSYAAVNVTALGSTEISLLDIASSEPFGFLLFQVLLPVALRRPYWLRENIGVNPIGRK